MIKNRIFLKYFRAISLLFALIFSLPRSASAQGVNPFPTSFSGALSLFTGGFSAVASGIFDVSFTAVSKVAFLISYILSVVLGTLVAIEAWAIGIVINLNTNIVGSPVVANGFPVMLSLANLAFVLGIVVIAVMTIIRNQTYGTRKVLFRLIMMALLVNFGLVIAGTLLGFADNLTLYWLNGMNPVGSTGGATNGFQSMNNFASSLAGAFNPQRGIVFSEIPTVGTEGVVIQTSQGLGAMLRPIISIIFTVFTLLAIVITLGVFIIMLVVRYVYLALLLVLLPLAWASSAFPGLDQNKKWWDKFIQQTFFAPVVIFFMWLVIKTAKSMSDLRGGPLSTSIYRSDGNPFWATISNLLSNVFSPIVENMLQTGVLVGLTIGGLYAAQRLGIEFAGAGITAAKATAKGVGGYVGRRTAGAFARSATSAKPEPAKTGVGRALQTLMRPVRSAAQSDVAKSYGITKAVETYGQKTNFGTGTNVRLAAKEKFRLARQAAEGSAERAQLEKEARALMALAAKRRNENKGLLGTVLVGTGLWKSGKSEVTKAETETLRGLQKPIARMETITSSLVDASGKPIVTTVQPPPPQTFGGRAQKGIEEAIKFADLQRVASANDKREALKTLGATIEEEKPEEKKAS